MDEHEAFKIAIETAKKSPCCKSKRGVVLWHRFSGDHIACFNTPPAPFVCSEDSVCRDACNKICIHAEANCLVQFAKQVRHAPLATSITSYEMLHVKVVDGQPVKSGPPSCWQCSRLILVSGLRMMWLLHDGLRGYPPEEFHRLTLYNNQLPDGAQR